MGDDSPSIPSSESWHDEKDDAHDDDANPSKNAESNGSQEEDSGLC